MTTTLLSSRQLTREGLYTLGLPDNVVLPRFDLLDKTRQVLHFGPGEFFLAHLGTYLGEIRNTSPEWGVRVVSPRTSEMVNALGSSKLYVVMERSNGHLRRTSVQGAIVKATFGPDNRSKVVDSIGDPRTKLITLTITDKGYHASPVHGINTGNPDVVNDLTLGLGQGGKPKTVFWYMALGLALRSQIDAPLTIMSCDNLENNGKVLRAALLGYLREGGQSRLAEWVAGRVAFPCTCVDRITPESTKEMRAEASNALGGVQVDVAVATEPFRQFIIDESPYPVPDWTSVGAEVVTDCTQHQRVKIVALNGGHQVVGLAGQRVGERYIYQAMSRIHPGDPGNRTIATLLEMAHQEWGAFLGDVEEYAAQVRERFADTALDHTVERVVSNASRAKIGPRLLMPVEAVLKATDGNTIARASVFAVACWIHNLLGNDQHGTAIRHNDDTVKDLQGPATAIRDWVHAVDRTNRTGATASRLADENDDEAEIEAEELAYDQPGDTDMQVLASNFAELGRLIGDDRFVRLATNQLFMEELAWSLLAIYSLKLDNAIVALQQRCEDVEG